MWRRTAAISFVFLGCSASPDDGAPADNASAGNPDPPGGLSGAGGTTTGEAGMATGVGGKAMGGGAGTSSAAGAGGTGGNPGRGGSGGGSVDAGKEGGSIPGSTGKVGVWENVTPAGVMLDPGAYSAGNFGVQDVVADPVRPSDLYVGICYQGFWRSTDFGATWKKVSTGTNSDALAAGRPWSAAIDNDKRRDPTVAPALYTTDGYGSKNGVFKSTDWGVSWTIYAANLSPYSFDIDPYDNQHLITGLHEAEGLAETTDGGVNWKSIATSIGKSIYPHFIDTGAAATTRKTWLAVPQMDTGPNAMMTTDGGATFHSVGAFAHPHGGNQAFNAGSGTAYVGASGGGVWRTLDAGATWKTIAGSSDNGYANGVIGTVGWLYAWDDGANAGGIGSPHLAKAPRNPGTAWTAVTTPTGMNNGGKTMAVTYDGAHYIMVSGSWNAGIWRYIEP